MLAAAVLLAVALLAGIGTAAPASAAGPATSTTVGEPVVEPASFDDCSYGRICVYIAKNGGSLPGWRQLLVTNPGSCTFAGIVGVTGLRGALSVANRSNTVQKVWTGTNCTGSYSLVFPGNEIGNLGTARWSVGGQPSADRGLSLVSPCSLG